MVCCCHRWPINTCWELERKEEKEERKLGRNSSVFPLAVSCRTWTPLPREVRDLETAGQLYENHRCSPKIHMLNIDLNKLQATERRNLRNQNWPWFYKWDPSSRSCRLEEMWAGGFLSCFFLKFLFWWPMGLVDPSACGTLVPRPGIKPESLRWKVDS